MVTQVKNIDFAFTDGWHPTVNPSSRMPIFYLRHKQLFPSHPIILNEFPRTKGGSTFRFIRFEESTSLQKIFVKSQSTLFEFMPWWLPSTLSESFLFQIYNDVLKSDSGITAAERHYIEEVYTELKEKISTELSIGELLNSINFDRYKIILPDLPEINCTSFSKSIFKNIFRDTLSINQERFFYVLNQLCKRQEITCLTKVAFCNDTDYNIYRISWISPERHFYKSRIDVRTGEKIDSKEAYSYGKFISDIEKGCIVLSSKITCIAEAFASLSGKIIFHFGNTYNHLAEIAAIISERREFDLQTSFVNYFNDNEDTWNFAYLRFSNDYPIHLFDLLPLNDKVLFKKIDAILSKSFEVKTPIYIPTTTNLSESINAIKI